MDAPLRDGPPKQMGYQLSMTLNAPFMWPMGASADNLLQWGCYEVKTLGGSLLVSWLGLGAFIAAAQVQSLVWELRSHIALLHAVAEEGRKEGEGRKREGGSRREREREEEREREIEKERRQEEQNQN